MDLAWPCVWLVPQDLASASLLLRRCPAPRDTLSPAYFSCWLHERGCALQQPEHIPFVSANCVIRHTVRLSVLEWNCASTFHSLFPRCSHFLSQLKVTENLRFVVAPRNVGCPFVIPKNYTVQPISYSKTLEVLPFTKEGHPFWPYQHSW